MATRIRVELKDGWHIQTSVGDNVVESETLLPLVLNKRYGPNEVKGVAVMKQVEAPKYNNYTNFIKE